MAKNAPKITKKEIVRRLRCFFLVHFRIYSLTIFEGGGLGAWPPRRPHAVLNFDPSQCFYRAMHFSAKGGLAIALCRPSVSDVGGL